MPAKKRIVRRTHLDPVIDQSEGYQTPEEEAPEEEAPSKPSNGLQLASSPIPGGKPMKRSGPIADEEFVVVIPKKAVPRNQKADYVPKKRKTGKAIYDFIDEEEEDQEPLPKKRGRGRPLKLRLGPDKPSKAEGISSSNRHLDNGSVDEDEIGQLMHDAFPKHTSPQHSHSYQKPVDGEGEEPIAEQIHVAVPKSNSSPIMTFESGDKVNGEDESLVQQPQPILESGAAGEGRSESPKSPSSTGHQSEEDEDDLYQPPPPRTQTLKSPSPRPQTRQSFPPRTIPWKSQPPRTQTPKSLSPRIQPPKSSPPQEIPESEGEVETDEDIRDPDRRRPPSHAEPVVDGADEVLQRKIHVNREDENNRPASAKPAPIKQYSKPVVAYQPQSKPTRPSRPSFAAAQQFHEHLQEEGASESEPDEPQNTTTDFEPLPEPLPTARSYFHESLDAADNFEIELETLLSKLDYLRSLEDGSREGKGSEGGYMAPLTKAIESLRNDEYDEEGEQVALDFLDRMYDDLQSARDSDERIAKALQSMFKIHAARAEKHLVAERGILGVVKKKKYDAIYARLPGGQKRKLYPEPKKRRDSNRRTSDQKQPPRASKSSNHQQHMAPPSPPAPPSPHFQQQQPPPTPPNQPSSVSSHQQSLLHEDWGADFEEPVGDSVEVVHIEGFGKRKPGQGNPYHEDPDVLADRPWSIGEDGAVIRGLASFTNQKYQPSDRFRLIRESAGMLRKRTEADIVARAKELRKEFDDNENLGPLSRWWYGF